MKKRKKIKEFKLINVPISRELRAKFKMLSIHFGTTQKDITIDFISAYILENMTLENEDDFSFKHFGKLKRRGENKIENRVFFTMKMPVTAYNNLSEIAKKYELITSSVIHDFIQDYVEKNSGAISF